MKVILLLASWDRTSDQRDSEADVIEVFDTKIELNNFLKIRKITPAMFNRELFYGEEDDNEWCAWYYIQVYYTAAEKAKNEADTIEFLESQGIKYRKAQGGGGFLVPLHKDSDYIFVLSETKSWYYKNLDNVVEGLDTFLKSYQDKLKERKSWH